MSGLRLQPAHLQEKTNWDWEIVREVAELVNAVSSITKMDELHQRSLSDGVYPPEPVHGSRQDHRANALPSVYFIISPTTLLRLTPHRTIQSTISADYIVHRTVELFFSLRISIYSRYPNAYKNSLRSLEDQTYVSFPRVPRLRMFDFERIRAKDHSKRFRAATITGGFVQ